MCEAHAEAELPDLSNVQLTDSTHINQEPHPRMQCRAYADTQAPQ